MYKFISKPLQFHLNGHDRLKVHVSDAMRFGTGADAVILRLPTQRRSATALEAILISGIELFETFGNIKVNELCDHAGVSIGTFYTYFKSTEHLLRYFHLLHLQDCEAGSSLVASSANSLNEKIILGARYIYDAHSSNRRLHKLFKDDFEIGKISNQIVKELSGTVVSSMSGPRLEMNEAVGLLTEIKTWVEDDRSFFMGIDFLNQQIIKYQEQA